MKAEQLKRMEGHTAGPWSVSDKSIVTEAYCVAVIEDDGGYEAPERDVNIHLIAAAPRLLAERNALLAACKAVRDDWGKNLTEAMTAVGDAIALAESE